MPDFVIARNPSEGTRLPFLLRLPLSSGDIVLATREVWPRTGDLYCHPVAAWPDEAEDVTRVPVERCWRSGAAIHLVLQRRNDRRSMFVWTHARGRQMVFWRSTASMRGARPGVRVPGASGLERGPLTVAVDSNERYPWKFGQHDVQVVRRALPVGDYAVLRDDAAIAAIERKRIPDLASSLVGGRLTTSLGELAQLPRAAIVIEGRLSDLIRQGEEVGVASGWLLNALAALQAAHPRVAWMFAETRKLAEDWAYRWLSACARQETGGDEETAELGPLTLRDAGARRRIVLSESAGIAWEPAMLAERTGVTPATATKDLRQLVDDGELRRERRGRRVVYVSAADPHGGPRLPNAGSSTTTV